LQSYCGQQRTQLTRPAAEGSNGTGRDINDHAFIEAFVRARGRHSNAEWSRLSPRQIAEAVHREIGTINAEQTQMPPGKED
jgi:hypothetical protein